jgi:hypothetical protein
MSDAKDFVVGIYSTVRDIADSTPVDVHVNRCRAALGMDILPEEECEHTYEVIYEQTLYKRIFLCDKIVNTPRGAMCTKCGKIKEII